MDGLWTHPDYGQELVQGVQDYLHINLVKLKDYKDQSNRKNIMVDFEERFARPKGMLAYMKERIADLDGTTFARQLSRT